MPHPPITESDINAFQHEGVVMIRGLFRDWIETIRAGIERNLSGPGACATKSQKPGEGERPIDDCRRGEHLPEIVDAVRNSQVAAIGAALLCSTRVQVFRGQVLVLELGTSKPTTRHQDGPDDFVQGHQTVSFCSPMDPISDATLRRVPGSQRRPWRVLPTRGLTETNFNPDRDAGVPAKKPRELTSAIGQWHRTTLRPSISSLCLARGNTTDQQRRAFSLRLFGDEARCTRPPARTSPPFSGQALTAGQRLRRALLPA